MFEKFFQDFEKIGKEIHNYYIDPANSNFKYSLIDQSDNYPLECNLEIESCKNDYYIEKNEEEYPIRNELRISLLLEQSLEIVMNSEGLDDILSDPLFWKLRSIYQDTGYTPKVISSNFDDYKKGKGENMTKRKVQSILLESISCVGYRFTYDLLFCSDIEEEDKKKLLAWIEIESDKDRNLNPKKKL